jgi:hypothetical protein
VARWATPDGRWTVDRIEISLSGGPDGVWFRVKQRGYFHGEVRTWGQLKRFPFDVSSLRQVPEPGSKS